MEQRLLLAFVLMGGVIFLSQYLLPKPQPAAQQKKTAEIAKKQFPTMPLEDLTATLDRSFTDEMWSKDGMVSRAAWDTGKAVVMEAGILKTDVKYEEIFDMSFVESIRASL